MLLRHAIAVALVLPCLSGCSVLFTAFAVGGIGYALIAPEASKVVGHDKPATLKANAGLVYAALAAYHKRTGHYPPADRWLAELARPDAPVLIGGGLLPSPFGDKVTSQANSLGIAELGGKLRPAGAPEGPSPKGTVLGPGRDPVIGNFTPLTYGALLYDVDASRQHYVLYAVGKQGDQAVVGHFVTDAGPKAAP